MISVALSPHRILFKYCSQTESACALLSSSIVVVIAELLEYWANPSRSTRSYLIFSFLLFWIIYLPKRYSLSRNAIQFRVKHIRGSLIVVVVAYRYIDINYFSKLRFFVIRLSDTGFYFVFLNISVYMRLLLPLWVTDIPIDRILNRVLFWTRTIQTQKPFLSEKNYKYIIRTPFHFQPSICLAVSIRN